MSESGEVLMPRGFTATGVHAGLKPDATKLDLALLVAERPCAAAGVFTRNHFPGEPVKLARKRLASGRLQAILVNSRISNVGTGEAGYRMAEGICAVLAGRLGIAADLACISSTGIIGRLYPEDVIEKAIPAAVARLGATPGDLRLASQAIMTTDTRPKCFSARCGQSTLSIIAKGAGMIAPNMATMLAFILTDADLPASVLQPMLGRVADATFNRISVDSDTSTSDSCFLLASGLAGAVDAAAFEQALLGLCVTAAKALVADGEGVDKVIECRVTGAASAAQASAVGRSVVDSPLIKTMVTGADPNWGRLLMAVGKVHREPGLAAARPTMAICGERVFLAGQPHGHDPKVLSRRMREASTVLIEIDLGLGRETATLWGGNLTATYVSVNADYTT